MLKGTSTQAADDRDDTFRPGNDDNTGSDKGDPVDNSPAPESDDVKKQGFHDGDEKHGVHADVTKGRRDDTTYSEGGKLRKEAPAVTVAKPRRPPGGGEPSSPPPHTTASISHNHQKTPAAAASAKVAGKGHHDGNESRLAEDEEQQQPGSDDDAGGIESSLEREVPPGDRGGADVSTHDGDGEDAKLTATPDANGKTRTTNRRVEATAAAPSSSSHHLQPIPPCQNYSQNSSSRAGSVEGHTREDEGSGAGSAEKGMESMWPGLFPTCAEFRLSTTVLTDGTDFYGEQIGDILFFSGTR